MVDTGATPGCRFLLTKLLYYFVFGMIVCNIMWKYIALRSNIVMACFYLELLFRSYKDVLLLFVELNVIF